METGHNLLQLLRTACDHYADMPAFSCLGHTLSYREVDRLADALCAWLQQRTDLAPGDRLAILLPNLLQYPVAVYAALRAGLVVVNTNPQYTGREIRHQFADAGVKAAIVLDAMLEKVLQATADTPLETIVCTGALDLYSAVVKDIGTTEQPATDLAVFSLREVLAEGTTLESRPVAAGPSDLALLQYTGGTTGVAKGAMLTHGNLVANVRQVTGFASASFVEGVEIYVSPLPLYHIYAFNISCFALPHRGGHSLLIPYPRDTDALVAAIREHPFTGFVGINTLFNALLHNPGFRQLDFSHLRSTSSGGMALTPDIAAAWLALTGVEIGEGYGLTETAPVVATNPRPGIQLGTVGLPVPGTEVKVTDGEGRSLPADTPGELQVRGPQVMQGYWQRPEETAQVLSGDGWLRTGDIAVIQEDGYVRLVDRAKDMIVVSGFNVYPNEVEEVASSHPGVLECAVVGVPDAVTGEAVKLFVVPTDAGLDPAALRNYLRDRLTGYKVPAQVEFRPELPKSSVGKILRRELR